MIAVNNNLHQTFSREQWATLNKLENRSLHATELEKLKNIHQSISLAEVYAIYLPLASLINNYCNSTKKKPFILSITGSVSAGKSTSSQILQILLSSFPEPKNIALINTDGFLYPNATLEEKGIMNRKGFPESYDTVRLIQFLTEIKTGNSNVKAPLYSHELYDVIPDHQIHIHPSPDILILEGLHLLKPKTKNPKTKKWNTISDFLDFSIYIDAEEESLIDWFLVRFMSLRTAALQDPNSYFHIFSQKSEEECINMAKNTWHSINGKNLHEHILPTRQHANLILHKNSKHSVNEVTLLMVND
ncbi:MAG: type I pantothenate kinase [Bacteroidales bacterium]|jgi:type I pantothenate kinase|nr:type I pantothenate kinase [Bacteroidales bacterium]